MRRHVEDLLFRRLEEELTAQERPILNRHLAVCADCSTLAEDIERNEMLLSRREAALPLPPRRSGAPAVPLRGLSVVLAVAAAVVFGLVAGTWLADRQPVGLGPAPGPSPTTEATSEPQLPETTDLMMFFDRGRQTFIAASVAGEVVARLDVEGEVMSQSALAASTGRLAVFRRAPDGPLELLIWTVADATAERSIPLGPRVPLARPVWAADGASVAVTIGNLAETRAPGTPPATAQILIVSASGEARVLIEYEQEHPLVPIAFSGQEIAGLIGSATPGQFGYVVLGVEMTVPPTYTPAEWLESSGQDAAGTTVWGVVHEFESPEPPRLRIWPFDSYSSALAELAAAGMGRPAVWPERTAVVFGSQGESGDYLIQALDWSSGRLSRLAEAERPIVLVEFSPDGKALLLQYASPPAFNVRAVRGDELGAEHVYRISDPFLTSGLQFIGWLRGQ